MAEEKAPGSMETMALEIARSSMRHAGQLTKERLQAEWRTKRQPTKPQAPPCGLFEQRQETLDI